MNLQWNVTSPGRKVALRKTIVFIVPSPLFSYPSKYSDQSISRLASAGSAVKWLVESKAAPKTSRLFSVLKPQPPTTKFSTSIQTFPIAHALTPQAGHSSKGWAGEPSNNSSALSQKQWSSSHSMSWLSNT